MANRLSYDNLVPRLPDFDASKRIGFSGGYLGLLRTIREDKAKLQRRSYIVRGESGLGTNWIPAPDFLFLLEFTEGKSFLGSSPERLQNLDKVLLALLKDKVGENGKSIKFPASLKIGLDRNALRLMLNADSVIQNMQDDDAAFEGWAFVLRHWIDRDLEIVLDWEKPELQDQEGHYQRFLYRVVKMRRSFNWFNVGPGSESHLHDLEIEPSKSYYLSYPGKPGLDSKHLTKKEKNKETFLERYIQENPASLQQEFGLDAVHYQLPVGVFRDRVADSNNIFPSKKSAIDLWGISAEQKKFVVFELKVDRNRKVGIISELFFYANVMRDMLNPDAVFKYSEVPHTGSKERGTAEEFVMIPNLNTIEAVFLAPELHPLIDQSMIEMINSENKDQRIHFSYHTLDEEYQQQLDDL